MIRRQLVSNAKNLFCNPVDLHKIRPFSAAAAPAAAAKTAPKDSKGPTKAAGGKGSATATPAPAKAAPKVSTKSWARDGLRKQGEEMFSYSAPFSYTLITDETITSPSAKVQSLGNEILSLTAEDRDKMFAMLEERIGFAAREIVKQTIENGGVMPGAEAATEVVAEAPKEEKTSFTLKLAAVDAKAKIKVIKEVRTITGLGLKEAKELVEKAPVVLKEGLKKEEVEAFIKSLTDAGAEAKME